MVAGDCRQKMIWAGQAAPMICPYTRAASSVKARIRPANQYFARFNVPVKNPQWLSRMRRESPLAHAATLRTPLVLWAGAKDDRVAIQSVTQLAAQVALEGHMPVLMIDPQSGHNPNHAISAHALMHLIEQSAATHLGGKLEPAEAPLGRFIARNLRMGTMR
jgi:hypothetical protein